MSIKECYPYHSNALTREGLVMKNFPSLKELWENADERDKNKKENIKGRNEEGHVTLFFKLVSHNYGGRKSIV